MRLKNTKLYTDEYSISPISGKALIPLRLFDYFPLVPGSKPKVSLTELHPQLFLNFIFETGSYYNVQVGLELKIILLQSPNELKLF